MDTVNLKLLATQIRITPSSNTLFAAACDEQAEAMRLFRLRDRTLAVLPARLKKC